MSTKAFGIVCGHGIPRDKWCGECYRKKYICTVGRNDLRGVQAKYRQLVREIETGASKANMLHSVQKLGCFLSDMLGYTTVDGKPGVHVWNDAAAPALHDPE